MKGKKIKKLNSELQKEIDKLCKKYDRDGRPPRESYHAGDGQIIAWVSRSECLEFGLD